MLPRLLALAVLVIVGVSLSAQAQTAASSELKAELIVCTSVVDRVPQGADSTFALSVGSIWCWSKVTGASGETTVTHVWVHNGSEVARVPLQVRAGSWRTWSQKNLYDKTGNWEVKLLDASGNTVSQVSFTVTP
jgi:hypothetical protein